MANVKREDRVSDQDIKRLNHIGIGLKAISKILGCHQATVTIRLKALNIKPTDTRRSFMEKMFFSLPDDVQDWLSTNLYNEGIPVHTFVTQLIMDAYKASPVTHTAAPTPLPPMETEAAPLTEFDRIELPDAASCVVLMPPEKVLDTVEPPPPAPTETRRLFGS